MSDANEEQMIATPAEFGNFMLEKELGHGGMGGVYLGRDRMLDRPVGIKVMLKSLGDDPTFVERFQREAQAAARLNHPNIAQIYSFGTEQGMPYIAMELCTGGSLDKEMEQHPGTMDPVKVMRLGRQLAEALALAAEQGLVHGDVKPENVLYDNDGNAKLVDFGLAAMQGDSDEIWGTPYYISPEKVRRQPIDYRADIYSLGGTLYHALTGQPPFEGEDATAVVKARFAGPPPKPSALRPELSPEIDAIVMRMLELEPARRYPTYGSLLGDLRRYLEKAGPEKSSTPSTRIRLKGKKIKSATHAVSAGAGDGDAAVPAADAAEEDEGKHMSIGLIVGLVVLGILLALGAVVGALFWYVHNEEVKEREAEQRLIVETRTKARAAIANSRKAVVDFGDNFTELVAKAEKEMKDAAKEIRACLTDEMLAAAGGTLQPPIENSKDIADAKAYVAAEEAKAAAAEAEAAAAEAAAKAQAAEAAAQAAATNAPAAEAAAATNAPAATAQPAATNAPAATKAPAAKPAAKPAVAEKAPAPAEKKPEAAPAETAEKPAPPPVEVPPDLKNFIALWNDFYQCRAAEIRVKGRVALLLKEIDVTLARMTAEDAAGAKKLAEYSTKLLDAFGDIKSMKCVEQTLKKVGVIKSKSHNLAKTIEKQAARAKAKAEKAAKEKAAAEAKAATEAKAAEAYKARAAEECKQVQEKWETLQTSLVRHLSWDLCKRQIQGVGVDFATQEGRNEIRLYQKRAEMMGALQQQLITKGRGTVFFAQKGLVKTEIVRSDAKNGIAWVVSKKVKGQFVKGKEQKADWEKFYQKAEYRGLMKRLIVQLVVKGQDDSRTRQGPMKWADCMLGAALTMQVFMSDDPELSYVETLVKKAVEGFEPCRRYAAKFFPDVDIGAAPEEEE